MSVKKMSWSEFAELTEVLQTVVQRDIQANGFFTDVVIVLGSGIAAAAPILSMQSMIDVNIHTVGLNKILPGRARMTSKMPYLFTVSSNIEERRVLFIDDCVESDDVFNALTNGVRLQQSVLYEKPRTQSLSLPSLRI